MIQAKCTTYFDFEIACPSKIHSLNSKRIKLWPLFEGSENDRLKLHSPLKLVNLFGIFLVELI